MALESRTDNADRVAHARLPDRAGLVLMKSKISEDKLSSPRKELEMVSYVMTTLADALLPENKVERMKLASF